MLGSGGNGDHPRHPRLRLIPLASLFVVSLVALRRIGISPLGDLTFISPSSRSAKEAGVLSRINRRDIFTGLFWPTISILPSSAEAEDTQFSKQARYASNACRCCEVDWCVNECLEKETGVRTQCDCYEYLTNRAAGGWKKRGGGLYRLPKDASHAREDALAAGEGEDAWAKYLKWETASLLKYRPETGSKIEVRPSRLGEGSGDGLFAKAELPQYTVFQPYMGKPLGVADLKKIRSTDAMDYVWCPASEGELLTLSDDELQRASDLGAATTFCIDSKATAKANPSRYINGARNQDQCRKVNVEICEFGQVAYFRTTEDVYEGTELVTDYGIQYWENFTGCP